MDDSSHGSAHPESRLDAARSRCANRDILIAPRATSSPLLNAVFSADAESAGATAVERAARAKRWRGWVEQAGAAAPRAPMWTSRAGWLTALSEWAHSPGFGDARESARVSITAATVLAIAAVMAEHADHATGRHVAVTRATIADRVGCDVRTVTAAWRLLRTAGWAVEAQRGHGSPGTPRIGRRPSVYHLVPRKGVASPVHGFHLPPSRRDRRLTLVCKDSPSAQKRAETFNISSKTTASRAPMARPWRTTARPLTLQRLAADLVSRTHGLDRGHIGSVCDAITAAGIDPETWTARAITDALNADMRSRGWSWPDHVARPGAFLAHRLRRLHWRPEGPQESGGVTAAGMQKGSGSAAAVRPPLTDVQRERIAAARADIRAVLAARHGGGERDRQGDNETRLGAAFGAPLASARRGESQFFEAGRGEESAGSDGAVFGRVGAEFGVGLGAQLRRAVAMSGEPVEGGGGFGA